jgi:hypothetical protein
VSSVIIVCVGGKFIRNNYVFTDLTFFAILFGRPEKETASLLLVTQTTKFNNIMIGKSAGTKVSVHLNPSFSFQPAFNQLISFVQIYWLLW